MSHGVSSKTYASDIFFSKSDSLPISCISVHFIPINPIGNMKKHNSLWFVHHPPFPSNSYTINLNSKTYHYPSFFLPSFPQLPPYSTCDSLGAIVHALFTEEPSWTQFHCSSARWENKHLRLPNIFKIQNPLLGLQHPASLLVPPSQAHHESTHLPHYHQVTWLFKFFTGASTFTT